jgi:hypothetical protein
MVSDHTFDVQDNVVSEFGGDLKWSEAGASLLSAKEFWRVNSLLMIKDFNDHGELVTNWQFMSNADAHSIAFSEFDSTVIGDSVSRILPVFFVGNLPRSTSKKCLPAYKQFNVKDNLFNPENWTPVDNSN